MKKLEPKDLQGLSEIDQGLLFNYFGAIGGVEHRRKLALGSALFGCLLIGMVYFMDVVLADVPNAPEWFPMVQRVAKVFPAVVMPIGVFWNLWLARSYQQERQAIGRELADRGLDASGLTHEQVFDHVAMPMFRRSGLRIKE